MIHLTPAILSPPDPFMLAHRAQVGGGGAQTETAEQEQGVKTREDHSVNYRPLTLSCCSQAQSGLLARPHVIFHVAQ